MNPRRDFDDAARRRDLPQMESALRAMEHVTLLDALRLLDAMAAAGDPRFGRWSRRWRDRLIAERPMQASAIAEVDRLLALMPSQSPARAVTLALRSYIREERNEWWLKSDRRSHG